MRMILRIAMLALLPLSLGSCDFFFNSGPNEHPGTIAVYNFTDFTQGLSGFFFTDQGRASAHDDFYVPMTQTNHWSGPYYQSGVQNNAFNNTNPTSSQLTHENHNVVYFSSHGGIVNNVAQLCLRDCNGRDHGGTVAVNATDFPNAWQGPRWLVIDACGAVLPNVGWENVFGGYLHGILGWNGPVHGLATDGYAKFADLTGKYTNAFDVWTQSAKQTGDSMAYAALIPHANIADAMEAPGGDHFGTDSNTQPEYWHCCDTGGGPTTSSVAKSAQPLSTSAQLLAETMDEPAWENQYQANSPMSQTQISAPNSNLHVAISPGSVVKHYLASGGVTYASKTSGTARGFTLGDAYNYALAWLASNGGLPGDAYLTYAGTASKRPYVDPWSLEPTQASGPTEYIFQWRHRGNFLVGGDSIVIAVDDAGGYEQHNDMIEPDPNDTNTWYTIQYYTEPWSPIYNVNSYRRLWHAIRSISGTRRVYGYQVPSEASSVQASAYAYCSPAMDDLSMTAQPCDLYPTPGGSGYISVDATTGIANHSMMSL